MDQDQRELRRAAAQAFIESLEQLAACFESKQVCSGQAHPIADEWLTSDEGKATDLEMLEAADIGQRISND